MIYFIIVILIFNCTYLYRDKKKNQNEELNKSKDKFLPLYPLDELSDKQMKIKNNYFETILAGIKDKKIFNIGIIGSYGSGKSTIINVFKKMYSEFNYLSIELSDFESIDIGNKEDEKSNKRMTVDGIIEQSILQQLIFSVKSNKVQRSRIKRIKKMTTKNQFFPLVFWLLGILSIDVLIWPNLLFSEKFIGIYKYIFNNSDLSYSDKPFMIFKIFSLIIFIFFIGTIIYYIYLKSDLFNISKIGISDKFSMTKVGEKSNKSFLNKYIDEIIYYIDKGDFDIIIIEDLDRFEEKRVFFQLRKINDLINRNSSSENKVTFIYAVKDDIFTVQDRVKFFELIVPIIPELHSSNSASILLKFKEEKKFNINKLAKNFLTDISIFIEDRRLLNNICNEYYIYSKTLINNKGEKLDYEQLFTIIIYKNLYPYDFHNLYSNKGFMYLLLESVDKISKNVSKKIKEIEEKIEKKTEKIVESEEELRSIYLAHLISKNPRIFNERPLISGTNIRFNESSLRKFIKNSDLFSKLYKSKKRIGNQKNFYNFFEKFESKKEYNYYERLRLINNDKELSELKEKKKKLYNEKLNIDNYTLKQMCATKEKIKKIKEEFRKLYSDEYEKYDNKNIKYKKNFNIDNHPLFIFIMKRGYIKRHTYLDYMNYFYPGKLNRKEMSFVKKVKLDQSTEIDIELENFDFILKKFNIDDYKNSGILNLSLIYYILNNEERYKAELKSIINTIKRDDNYKFIKTFLNFIKDDRFDTASIFMKNILNEWIEIGYHIEKESEGYLDGIIKLVLHKTDNIIIKEFLSKFMKIENRIKNIQYINDYFDVIDSDKMIDLVEKTNLKFSNVKDINSKNKFSSYLYNNNCYEINFNMIKNILESNEKDKLNISNYTLIMSSEKDELKNYINNEINYYIENVLLKSDNKLSEKEKFFLDILNNNEVDKENKIDLIEKSETIIERIDSVDMKELWKKFIERELVNVNWLNVNTYYLYDGPEDVLISYIENNIEKFSEMSIDKSEGLTSKKLNDISFILIEYLSKDLLIKILDKLYILKSERNNFSYDKDISFENIKVLIKNDILKLTEKNLKNNNEELIYFLIKYNIDEFINSKFKIIHNETEIINKIINEDHLEIKTRVDLLLKRGYFLKEDLNIPIKLLYFIIVKEKNKINKNKIIKLLINQLENINTNDARLYFIHSLGKEYKKIGTNKQARLDVNNENKLLLKKLKTEDIVTSYSVKQTKSYGKHYRCHTHIYYDYNEFDKNFEEILKEYNEG